jgi:hypothetical protein
MKVAAGHNKPAEVGFIPPPPLTCGCCRHNNSHEMRVVRRQQPRHLHGGGTIITTEVGDNSSRHRVSGGPRDHSPPQIGGSPMATANSAASDRILGPLIMAPEYSRRSHRRLRHRVAGGGRRRATAARHSAAQRRNPRHPPLCGCSAAALCRRAALMAPPVRPRRRPPSATQGGQMWRRIVDTAATSGHLGGWAAAAPRAAAHEHVCVRYCAAALRCSRSKAARQSLDCIAGGGHNTNTCVRLLTAVQPCWTSSFRRTLRVRRAAALRTE